MQLSGVIYLQFGIVINIQKFTDLTQKFLFFFLLFKDFNNLCLNVIFCAFYITILIAGIFLLIIFPQSK